MKKIINSEYVTECIDNFLTLGSQVDDDISIVFKESASAFGQFEEY